MSYENVIRKFRRKNEKKINKKKKIVTKRGSDKNFKKLKFFEVLKRFFYSKFRVASAHQYECSSQQAEKDRKSFKNFLSYFRKPLLPRIARKKRFRKLHSKRKEKRIFYSNFRVASAHQYECSSQKAEGSRKFSIFFQIIFVASVLAVPRTLHLQSRKKGAYKAGIHLREPHWNPRKAPGKLKNFEKFSKNFGLQVLCDGPFGPILQCWKL